MASKVELKTKTVVEDIKLYLELDEEEIVFLYDIMRSISGQLNSPRMYANKIADKIRCSFNDAGLNINLALYENYYEANYSSISCRNDSLTDFKKEVEQIFINVK